MSYQHAITYSILLLVIAGGCRKDEDVIPPEITIESPVANTWFDVLDTVPIKAQVKDNKQLRSVNIRLTDEFLTPVLQNKGFSPTSKTYDLTSTYVLDDIHLETGNYYLRISASDGINEGKEYIPVGIHAADVLPVGIMAAGSPGPGSSVIDLVATDLSGSTRLADLSTDLIAAKTNSLFQKTFLLSATGGLDILDVGTANVVNLENDADTYTGMAMSDNTVYVFKKNYGITVYSAGGNAVAGITPDPYFYTVNLYGQDDLLFTVNNKRNGIGNELIVYYRASSSEKQRTALNMDVVSMGRKSAHEVWIIGNENGAGKMWYYDIDLNVMTSWRTLDGGAVVRAIQLDDNNFLFATTAGISHYTYNPNSLTSFAGISDAIDIAYDALQSRLLILQTSGIIGYGYPGGSLLQSYNSSYPLTHFGIINSK